MQLSKLNGWATAGIIAGIAFQFIFGVIWTLVFFFLFVLFLDLAAGPFPSHFYMASMAVAIWLPVQLVGVLISYFLALFISERQHLAARIVAVFGVVIALLAAVIAFVWLAAY